MILPPRKKPSRTGIRDAGGSAKWRRGERKCGFPSPVFFFFFLFVSSVLFFPDQPPFVFSYTGPGAIALPTPRHRRFHQAPGGAKFIISRGRGLNEGAAVGGWRVAPTDDPTYRILGYVGLTSHSQFSITGCCFGAPRVE